MLQLRHPGVYVREIPSGVRSIGGAPTAIALFVGPTRGGIDRRPIRITSFADFERSFGGLVATSSLSYSVLHFFANGGGEAFVIRVPVKNAKASHTGLKQDGNANESLHLTALASGAAGRHLFLEVDPFDIGAKAYGGAHDKKRFNLAVLDRATGRAERFTNLSTVSTAARYAPAVVNDPDTGSRLVKLEVKGIDLAAPQATGTVYKVVGALGAGTFAADVKVQLSVAIPKDDGSLNAAASIDKLAVTAFPKDAEKPVSPLELANRLAAALNQAVRADATAAPKLQGFAVEVQAFSEENVPYLRLRTTRPEGTAATTRVADATVTLDDPAAGSLLGTYALAQQVANPSRYQLEGAYPNASQVLPGAGGADGDAAGQPDTNDFKKAVTDLEALDPFFNTLCLPDLVRPAANDPRALFHSGAMKIYEEAARICQLKQAFLLVDPLPSVDSVGAAESWKRNQFFQSSHAAAYFPNVRVDDPLVPGSIRAHPPSGAIAGLFARTDAQFGVWQAPAGTEAVVAGAYGPSLPLTDADQGFLNPLGVNCIRQFPIYGTVGFGSRTVDGVNELGSEWAYVPVRRTASYILRSLSDSLRWAVHKGNGEALWSQLRLNVTAFMHGLFRQGAFKGVSAREAYFVQCDASTTPPEDIAQGVVNIVVGFAPLRPAEFVVISLRQIVQPATA